MQTCNSDIEAKTQRQQALTKHEAIDFGPQNALLAVNEECIHIDKGEYRYELCFFGEAQQKRADDGGFVATLG